MIPEFVKIKDEIWGVLPPGIHQATLGETEGRFATNPRRRMLFTGLKRGIEALKKAGCRQVFIDGSYVTEKPQPRDYDLCWDPRYVDPDLLDPILWQDKFLIPPRSEQQQKYHGDYFQSTQIEGVSGQTFLEFFQVTKNSEKTKGILKIKIG